MKLNKQNLSNLGAGIAIPAYSLDERRQGIAHIGVGGFHRAHQAFYTDALMSLGANEGSGEGLDWAFAGSACARKTAAISKRSRARTSSTRCSNWATPRTPKPA